MMAAFNGSISVPVMARSHERNDTTTSPRNSRYFTAIRRSCSAVGILELWNPQPTCRVVDQLLKGAERAEPTTEHGPTPEEQPDQCKGGQDRNERVGQEIVPAKVGDEGVYVGDQVDDGELRTRVPAEPDKGPQEKADTNDAM